MSAAPANPRVTLALVVLVALLIGGNFTALKFALDHTTPLLLAGLRTVVGGTFLLGFVTLVRGERIPTDRSVLARIFVVSLAITTISSALLVIGVNRVPAGLASLLSSTMPLFTALLVLLLMGVRPTRLGTLGLVVGFAGTVVLASPSLDGEATAIGIVALAASALAWAFGTVFMQWRDFSAVSPVMIVAVQLPMSAAVLIPVALLTEGVADTDWSLGLFVPLAYAAIPANAVTFALMATIVKRAAATQAAATAYLIPISGVFFGWLIRDERLGAIELVGGVLVVAGVYLLVTANARAKMAATAS
ncbi:MAG: EamA family transporter [Ilumatobacter sp.]|uniref:DMT family transporter n=1 Tax=Ilumatobacter sp. TaxID=1967498 RepID=UPI003C706BEB